MPGREMQHRSQVTSEKTIRSTRRGRNSLWITPIRRRATTQSSLTPSGLDAFQPGPTFELDSNPQILAVMSETSLSVATAGSFGQWHHLADQTVTMLSPNNGFLLAGAYIDVELTNEIRSCHRHAEMLCGNFEFRNEVLHFSGKGLRVVCCDTETHHSCP